VERLHDLSQPVFAPGYGPCAYSSLIVSYLEYGVIFSISYKNPCSQLETTEEGNTTTPAWIIQRVEQQKTRGIGKERIKQT
jgi:hypothetical protein